MRRIALLICLALALAACSGDTGTTTTTVAADEAPATTTTAATTTTTTTTTTVPETTTTTTVAEALEFDTVAGTPPDAFDSFSADMTIAMTMGELAIEVSADGIWTQDAFACTVSSGLGGITFSESVLATPQQLWINQGSGYEPSSLFGSAAQEVMSSCPTSPLFWTSFSADDFGAVSGDEELIDGRPAVRADLADLVDTLGGFGLITGFEGAVIHEMTVWIDVETNTILALAADLEMSDELMGELAGAETGPVAMTMDFTISDVNDQSLSVDVPTS